MNTKPVIHISQYNSPATSWSCYYVWRQGKRNVTLHRSLSAAAAVEVASEFIAKGYSVVLHFNGLDRDGKTVIPGTEKRDPASPLQKPENS